MSTCAAARWISADDPSPGVRVITLDRPHRLNAMSGELISDLHRVIDEAAAEEECRVVVITGAGRGFCAGLDLKDPPPLSWWWADELAGAGTTGSYRWIPVNSTATRS